MDSFNNCKEANKINLTAGTYRDENLKLVIFRSVREAERRIIEAGVDRSYLPPTEDEK